MNLHSTNGYLEKNFFVTSSNDEFEDNSELEWQLEILKVAGESN